MIWTVYEITLNLYEGFLYTWFITKVLGKKSGEKWSFAACSLLTAGCLTCYLIFPISAWNDTWTFFFIVLYSFLFLRGKIQQKLFWDLLLIVMVNGFIGISYQVFHLISGADADVMLQEGIQRLLFTLSVNILLGLFLFLITRFFHERNETVQPSQLLLIIVLLCGALVDIFFRLTDRFDLPLVWLSVGSLITVIIAVMVLITNRFFVRYIHIEQEYLYQKEILDSSERQINEMKEVYGSTLKLRHDMRAFVKDIQEMKRRGEIDNPPRYLDEMEKEVLPLYSTGNQALDSVLMIKAAKIQDAGIEFRGSNLHYTGGMNIRDAMLCSLISNMLDNAREALLERKDQPGERFICLEFNYSPAGLMILCENPLLSIPPKMVKKAFISKKAEPYHGLGISIMEKITRDAGGHLEVLLYEDSFRVLALIPPKNHLETTYEKDSKNEIH